MRKKAFSDRENALSKNISREHQKILRVASIGARVLASCIIILVSVLVEPFDESHKIELRDAVTSAGFTSPSSLGSIVTANSEMPFSQRLLKYWAASCLRWDAFHFLNIARNGRWGLASSSSSPFLTWLGLRYAYEFEYEYAFMPGVPLAMKLGFTAWNWISARVIGAVTMESVPVYHYLISGAVLSYLCDPTWTLYK